MFTDVDKLNKDSLSQVVNFMGTYSHNNNCELLNAIVVTKGSTQIAKKVSKIIILFLTNIEIYIGPARIESL